MSTGQKIHALNYPKWTFTSLLFLVLSVKLVILVQFNFEYTDDDQAIMAYAATEYAQGRFHEPCFFGQDYNTHFESLLAVPLVWMNVDPFKALPIVSNLLALLPFILIAFMAFKKKAYFISYLALLYPVLLPLEYSLISSMPRGFVTGIAVASIGIFLLYSYSGLLKQFIAGFLMGFSLFLNPNALVLIIPVALLWVIENKRYIRKTIIVIIGGVIGFSAIYFSRLFYELNPQYVVHRAWPIEFKPDHFLNTLDNFVQHFQNSAPLVGKFGYFSLIILSVLILIAVIKRHWYVFISLSGGLLFILLTFFINKIQDGQNDIFFPYERMFLAIPVLTVFFLFKLFESVSLSKKASLLVLLSMMFLGVGFKFYKFDKRIQKLTSDYSFVIPAKLDDVGKINQEVVQVAVKNKVELVVFLEKNPVMTYSFPVMSDEKIRTISTEYDRRYWRIMEEKERIDENLIIITWNSDIVEVLKYLKLNFTKLNSSVPTYLIEGNTVKNFKLAESIDKKLQ